jgi:hypothetical protein
VQKKCCGDRRAIFPIYHHFQNGYAFFSEYTLNALYGGFKPLTGHIWWFPLQDPRKGREIKDMP